MSRIRSSTTTKTLRLTLFFCFFLLFRIFVSVFYSLFRCFFSFFVIIFSIIFDFETFRLSVSAEKTIQKIFRAENVIEKNIAFIAIVFDFLSIISSNEIAISNRNAEKKTQNEQNFSAKENSNDVERQHFDVFSSSLSSDVSKSNDQKNFDSLLIFLLCSLNKEQRRSFESDANFALDV